MKMPPCLPASLRDSFCAAANPYRPLSVRCRGQHLARYGLVNNAGIGTEGLLAMMHNSQIETLIRLNTLSPIVLAECGATEQPIARVSESSMAGVF